MTESNGNKAEGTEKDRDRGRATSGEQRHGNSFRGTASREQRHRTGVRGTASGEHPFVPPPSEENSDRAPPFLGQESWVTRGKFVSLGGVLKLGFTPACRVWQPWRVQLAGGDSSLVQASFLMFTHACTCTCLPFFQRASWVKV